MAHIVLDKASVELAIYNSRGRALKSEILRRTVGGGLQDDRDRSVQVVKALSDVSFEARDGDRIGRWPLSLPDLPVYRGPSRAGGGNAGRVS